MIINNIEFAQSLLDILLELRRQLALNDIEYIKIQPRESGRNIQIQCPYHGDGQERKPSAGIRKSDGMLHCFACGEVHSLPEVISYCFGKNDMGAYGWQWLLKNFLTIAVEERKDIELDYVRPTRDNRLTEGNQRFVTEDELDKYRYYHDYWTERGITDENIIELFDLGYDKETKCITFPVRDTRGNCLFVAKRSVVTKFFNYPKDVKKPLYGLYELEKVKAKPTEIIIVESMIDAILLWQHKHYTFALNGLGNELQIKQLRELPMRKFILATDNDKRGLEARDRIKAQLPNKIITEIVYPKGVKDPGDCTSEELDYFLDWERI